MATWSQNFYASYKYNLTPQQGLPKSQYLHHTTPEGEFESGVVIVKYTFVTFHYSNKWR